MTILQLYSSFTHSILQETVSGRVCVCVGVYHEMLRRRPLFAMRPYYVGLFCRRRRFVILSSYVSRAFVSHGGRLAFTCVLLAFVRSCVACVCVSLAFFGCHQLCCRESRELCNLTVSMMRLGVPAAFRFFQSMISKSPRFWPRLWDTCLPRAVR